MCDDNTLRSSRPRQLTMNILHIENWIRAYIQSSIKPPPILLIKVELEEERTITLVKFKMRRNPDMATSETYNINIFTFKDGQLEDFLAILNNFKIIIYVTGTTSLPGRINYLRMILSGYALRLFD